MDGYLHKKFKKQSSAVQPNHVPSIQQQQHQNQQQQRGHQNSCSGDLVLPQEISVDLSSKGAAVAAESSPKPIASFERIYKKPSDQSQEPYSNVSDIISTVNSVRFFKRRNSNDREQSNDDISSISTKSNNEPEQRSSILVETKTEHSDGPDDSRSIINIDQTSLPVAAAVTTASGTTTGSGKYVCTYCNLACSKPSVLQKHIRAHTNERPYPCVSCGFSFKTRSNLYKHCRSRSHANRLMGNKNQDLDATLAVDLSHAIADNSPERLSPSDVDVKNKPYKPRFHTNNSQFTIDAENEENNSPQINKVSQEKIPQGDVAKCLRLHEPLSNSPSWVSRITRYKGVSQDEPEVTEMNGPYLDEEPLNLTKNRKRCLSEASSEPVTQKSLIKELLLKNLYADGDTQCRHCKMIFQTVTELELHKMRNCKGRGVGPKYSRSSSVNVASILTQNKNAFDNIPQMQNTVFPLKSPGPFLGKTRLVEADKAKSFSYEDGIQILSPIKDEPAKPLPVKMFGGQVKISDSETYSDDLRDSSISAKYQTVNNMSENRVVKNNSLQSGGIVLQNQDKQAWTESEYKNDTNAASSHMFPSIKNFSKNAAKLLAPNLDHLHLKTGSIGNLRSPQAASALVTPIGKPPSSPVVVASPTNGVNPVNLLVNGKLVRYVPGMPGPVIAESLKPHPTILITSENSSDEPDAGVKVEASSPVPGDCDEAKLETSSARKFARPNSLPLIPASTFSLKQHHGLTPTMLNQILISPDTPRGAKKYNEHFLHGNYFSYLGLKSSTKPVYCTLNKTQPFYVPHFKKLSMYSEWRQQDNKADKLYVSNYDSRQRSGRYTIAEKYYSGTDVVHSSYKFEANEIASSSTSTQKDKDSVSKASSSILGGYESNEDYTYVRGRGRGRYVCEQCGIRCKKPSMLKKHIRTHSNDRPYTCKNCNFSFKTKGNLTKHMKSKAHTKNRVSAPSGSSSSQMSGGTSETDTDDSGMDSSDESSTRNQEHEAAYGLLTLSQKPAVRVTTNSELLSPCGSDSSFVNTEQLVHVSKSNYAKNKILNQDASFNTSELRVVVNGSTEPASKSPPGTGNAQRSLRPLTYPYNNSLTNAEDAMVAQPENLVMQQQSVIRMCGVSQRDDSRTYQKSVIQAPARTTSAEVDIRKRKLNRTISESSEQSRKIIVANDEVDSTQVMDLSMTVQEKHANGLDETDKHLSSSHALPKETFGVNQGNAYSEVNYLAPVKNGLRKLFGPDLLEAVPRPAEYDNSAMETLADIATKQEKLEKNSVAKNVATEFLMFATKMDPQRAADVKNFPPTAASPLKKDIVKSEENKSCNICEKTFSKPSQLRLHMNIHYLERPFRCESCSISFRTKGHLQKHERSASHHNKLSSSPALSSSEPRPFKCVDCKIAFRIHGHLAKHLRSKLHILKLECLSKIPFGLYAELERSNSLLTEINTADSDQCLDSLKLLAKRVFLNDPSKMNQLNEDISNGHHAPNTEHRRDIIIDAAMES